MILKKGLENKAASAVNIEHKPAGALASVMWGAIIALFLLTICSIILAFVYTKSNVDITYINGSKYAILALSLFFGGLLAGRKSGKKGLFHGLAVAVVFIIIAAIVTVNNAEMQLLPAVLKCIIAVLAGGIGGICGVK